MLRDDIINQNLEYTLFSWSKQKNIAPIAVERAEGVFLYDYDGKKYLDFCSGLVNVNVGHGDKRISDAVAQQMSRVSYVNPGCVTQARGELGEKIASLLPGDLTKSFFTVCGASAIENAIKLSRIVTQRHKVLARYQSYHGASAGALSASGDPRRLAMDAQQGPNFVHFDIPYAYRWKYGGDTLLAESLELLERTIRYEGPKSVAAILLEGESGSSGCLKYPDGYLKGVREICNRYGIMLIIDEVMSGFARTGKWFGFQHHAVVPDMICLAKGLTSGYLPMGCLVVSKRIVEQFNDAALPLGLTYSAHPVCCAAALATIKIYEEEKLVERAAEMGNYFQIRLNEFANVHPSIGDIRLTGLLGCIELVSNRTKKTPMAPFNATESEMAVMNKVSRALKENGLFAYVRWNYIFIAPPLTISKEEADMALQALDAALKIADEYANV